MGAINFLLTDPSLQAQAQVVALNPLLTAAQAATQIQNLISANGYTGEAVTPEGVDLWRSQRYVEYFLNSRSSVAQLETFELTHPGFSKTYRIVRNAVKGVTVKLETGGTAFFAYYPAKVSPQTARDDLDYAITINLGDLGEEFPIELDNVMKYPKGPEIKPTLIYRVYRSDDLNQPMFGPLVLEVAGLAFTKEGVAFEARAPNINATSTGEIYSLSRFPALRGFL